MTTSTPHPDIGPDILRRIADWTPRTDDERAAHASFRARFAGSDLPISRGSRPDHATASAVVFDPDLARTLLVFHGKGRFWVQPGGHIEDRDPSVADAALRELAEETGADPATVRIAGAYDLDHHALGDRFGACASHLDIGIAMIADPDAAVAVSDESEDVRWFPLDALPDTLARGAATRFLAMRERVRA
ncbi:NUDIX hydrolase [Microbacterium karelineae]|uniref:NUDIX hydrolase n=1 Tax=Microbacterium karelineae TaxID=2654283 RepID=UPI0012E9DD8E|nr:NUDIX domain-containing protein [Microbacterium karelineae]